MTPPVGMQAQLDELRGMLAQLLNGQAARDARAAAFERYQTTGAQALPMTLRQIGLVLDGGPGLGAMLQHNGYLKRRWPTVAGYHPDDVRAALETFAAAKAKRGPIKAEAATNAITPE